MTFETDSKAKRSGSRSRTPRPTTPLRPSSRSSFRDSAWTAGDGDAPFPLNTFEPAFAELSDAMADLEANMMHFQLMHESLARFSESFASFLYGLNMNAFCVDFPEAPILESFRRNRHQDNQLPETPKAETDPEITFMTTEVSFVDNPPASNKTKTRTVQQGHRQSRLPAARGSAES
ncbi:hypothetical protein LMH87_005768 [Akanthomyces muscarius]|uniref:DASH complex subunit DAM1 n=1 Tax=Akanthomyces muscarius TaxID=2231603 RepID=A0A9W8QPJ9_AKAMU|nr:hypothetical protein LMH87_005768 [Akanthomyces muscarius]KAJ4164082.1 hypothetical protein LMH87_005768 [Akanthomyces muscarius]